MSNDVVSDFFGGKQEAQLSTENDLDSSEYEETPCYAKRRGRGFELMLDVRLKDTRRFGLSYSYLRGIEIDGEEMTLHFMPYQVTVVGKKLFALYEAALAHQLRFIQEEGARFELLAEHRTFIAKIEVSYPSP